MIVGRPETFALEMSPLAGGPDDGDPASCATWASISLYVVGRNLFHNLNRQTEIVAKGVNWPAINLARWLVLSWNRLFHTGAWPKPGTRRNARDVARQLDEALAENFDASEEEVDSRDQFVAAHSMRASAAGAALPDLWLSRDGEVVSVAWRDSMDGETLFPVSGGEADVPALDFAEAVKGFVSWVHGLLEERCPTKASVDIKLLADWLKLFDSAEGASAALLSETGLSQRRCEQLAKSAGIPATLPALFDLDPAWFSAGTLADVRHSPIAVAFRCVAPRLSDDELVRVRHAIVTAERDAKAHVAIDSLARRVPKPISERHDYVKGYHLARGLREVRGNVSESLDVEAMLESLGVGIVELALSDQEIDGGCVCDATHGPLVFVNPRSKKASTKWGRRVVLAHELCHLLFDRHEAVSLGVMSGPWAPPRIERTANAFAIELLLPLAGVLETVGPAWEDMADDHVLALMDKYGLGITAVTEHLRNLADAGNR